MKPEIWCHADCEDAERLSGDCSSRDDAIADGRAEHEGGFWIFKCEVPDPASFLPSIDWLFEQMGENAYDECGEIAEGWPEPSMEAKKDLEGLLAYWARKYTKPTFWVASGNPEYIEPEGKELKP